MIMPWEVWDSENTSKEFTFGFSKKTILAKKVVTFLQRMILHLLELI